MHHNLIKGGKMDLVKIKKGEIFCDSNTVSQKFQIKHNKVIRTIENLVDDLSKLRGTPSTPKVVEFENEYRGQKFKSYYMNREFFSLLSMRFKGKKALEWQVKFNSAFYQMETRLLIELHNKQDENWVAQRVQGKLARKNTTDMIKGFVDYATDQGSKSAKFYYKHITNATYKALGLITHKQPGLRNTLDSMQLAWLMSAEYVAQESLKKHMATGEHYKAIFVLVKQDIEAFAGALLLN